MPLSATDQHVLDTMKEREFNLKKRQRAANAIYNERRRYRRLLLALSTVVVAVVLTAIDVATQGAFVSSAHLWRQALVVFILGAIFGMLVGEGWLHAPPGHKMLVKNEVRLNQKHSGDLHAGRRWQQFYYRDEDISAYIAQILYVIECEHRFDSVDEALGFVKAHCHENSRFRERGLELFNRIAAETNLIVISSSDEAGRPSSRFMRFVKTDRPGVWYVTTAPDAPKVHEFDRSLVAVITVPTESGATISSSRVHIRRADENLVAIADLYRTQAPRYLEGMTQEDQEAELVYELTFESAKLSSWVDQELVVFDHADLSARAPRDARERSRMRDG